MTRPCSVENTIKKRNANQGVGGAASRLRSSDQARQHAIELRLLGEDPASKAADLGRRCTARHPKGLRQSGVDRGDNEHYARSQQKASQSAHHIETHKCLLM